MIKNWSELPVGKLEAIRATYSIEDEDKRTMTVAGILADKTYNDILNMPLAETEKLIANTAFLYTEPKTIKIRDSYNLNGTIYIPLKKMEHMTTAQYIDYQALGQDSVERIAEFLAIFMVPEGCKYNDGGYDREKVVDDISQYMMAEEALGIADFFTRRCVRLIRRTLLLLEAKMTTQSVIGSKETRKQAKQAAKVIKGLRRIYG